VPESAARRVKFYRLTIPGTHGVWPRRINYSVEAWNRWYLVVTLRTQQFGVIVSGR
jgi:hypothetical protein